VSARSVKRMERAGGFACILGLAVALCWLSVKAGMGLWWLVNL
jgi:hypothetical protein